jgi:preprotein translocase subunit YajC
MLATPAPPVLFGVSAVGASGGSMLLVVQFLLIGGIFWFFMIRPQQARLKQHKAQIDAVKKGDTVVTAGGILGKVTKVDAEQVEVEIASGVKVKVIKATLTDVQALDAPKPAND